MKKTHPQSKAKTSPTTHSTEVPNLRKRSLYSADTCYSTGRKLYEQDKYAEAVKWYQKAAKQNHADAQYYLGRMYNYGHGVPQSDTKATEWYQKAADQNHADAQYYLGRMYNSGYGIPQSDTKAEEWYQKAADQNHAYAQHSLILRGKRKGAVIRPPREDLSKSDTQAVECWQNPTRPNNTDDLFELGRLHESVRSVDSDTNPVDFYQNAIKCYKKAALNGYKPAQVLLAQRGIKWEAGTPTPGVPIILSAANTYYSTACDLDRQGKYAEAVKCYQKAADQNHPDAQYKLGLMYYYGQGGLPKSDEEAVKWWQKAAAQNHAGAQYNLGVMYYYGQGGLPKSDEEAVKWWQKAAAQNHPGAQYNLGWMYQSGRGGLPKSDSEAVQWYQKAATQNHARAHYMLAQMYEVGRGGLPKTDIEAAKHLQEAASQNHAGAQYALGVMYKAGRGAPQSDTLAVEWYQKAAAQNNALAQYNLGLMHEHGRGGLPKSDVEAVKYYQKAADQNHPDAQDALAFMYANGRGGLPISDEEAVKCWQKAAAQNHPDAQFYLAYMYEHGNGGLPKSGTKAAEYYRKAADQNHHDAQFYLAWMYEHGIGGLPKSDTKAIEYYQKAALNGHAGAQDLLTQRGISWEIEPSTSTDKQKKGSVTVDEKQNPVVCPGNPPILIEEPQTDESPNLTSENSLENTHKKQQQLEQQIKKLREQLEQMPSSSNQSSQSIRQMHSQLALLEEEARKNQRIQSDLKKINDTIQLKEFYRTIHIALYQILMSCTAVAGGRAQAEISQSLIDGIVLVSGMLPVPMLGGALQIAGYLAAVINKTRQVNKSKRTVEIFIPSQLIPVTEEVARRLTLSYEEQLLQLPTPEQEQSMKNSTFNRMAEATSSTVLAQKWHSSTELLAGYGVLKMIAALEDEQVSEANPIDDLVSSVSKELTGKDSFLNAMTNKLKLTTLPVTKAGAEWTFNGFYTRPGLKKRNSQNNNVEYYTHSMSNHNSYGFRWISDDELANYVASQEILLPQPVMQNPPSPVQKENVLENQAVTQGINPASNYLHIIKQLEEEKQRLAEQERKNLEVIKQLQKNTEQLQDNQTKMKKQLEEMSKKLETLSSDDITLSGSDSEDNQVQIIMGRRRQNTTESPQSAVIAAHESDQRFLTVEQEVALHREILMGDNNIGKAWFDRNPGSSSCRNTPSQKEQEEKAQLLGRRPRYSRT